MKLPNIQGHLDHGIAPVVHALREAGWPTTSSCEGHDDAEFGRYGRASLPYVTVQAHDDPCGEARGLAQWVIEHGWANCWISVMWVVLDPAQSYADSYPSEPILAIDWWSKETMKGSSLTGEEA